MNNPTGQPLFPLPSHPLLPPPHKPRLDKVRSWLRSRTGRIIVPLVALVFGIAIGIASLLFYGLSGEGTVLIVPAPGKGDLIIEADKALLTHIVDMNLRDAGMPGHISNVAVDLALGDQMTIGGGGGFCFLGICVKTPFPIVVEPYVRHRWRTINQLSAEIS